MLNFNFNSVFNIDNHIISFAKSELEYYLNKMLNTHTKIIISFEKSDKILRYDGYEIECNNNQIAIKSICERGILHGAYELLRELGCNFVFPSIENEIIPKLKGDLPKFSLSREPWLEYRGMCLYNTTKQTLREALATISWMAKNGYNFLLTSIQRKDDTMQGDHAILWDEIGDKLLPELLKRGIEIDMSEHSTDYYFPREKHFLEHSEWFSEMNGIRFPLQICYSNLQAVNAYAESMAQFVKDKPWFKFFGIWPLDGGDYCQCENCKNPLTIYKANIIIAKRLSEVRSDLVVEHLAYTPQSFARPNEPAPNNMSVLVCSERGKIAFEWAQATKKGAGAFYFDYNTGDNYRWRSNTWLNPFYIKETINTMVSYGYRGIVSLYLPITAWWQASINYWYMRELYYNPVADIYELTQKLSVQLFGKAAGVKMVKVMWQVLTKLQSQEMWNGYPHNGDYFCEHITERNKELDSVQLVATEKLLQCIQQSLSKIKIPTNKYYNTNFTLFKDYLAMQREYYKCVEMYDAEVDTKNRAEPYFELLAKYEQEGKPFISEKYARWRITGRDNIFAVELSNEFAARTE